MKTLTPVQPYLLQAFYRWISDNKLTPYLLVKNSVPGVQLPSQLMQEERTVLNISERAVKSLDIGLDCVRFTACFGGVAESIELPMHSVLAVYSREQGKGIFFEKEQMEPSDVELDGVGNKAPPAFVEAVEDAPKNAEKQTKEKKKRAHLSVIK